MSEASSIGGLADPFLRGLKEPEGPPSSTKVRLELQVAAGALLDGNTA